MRTVTQNFASALELALRLDGVYRDIFVSDGSATNLRPLRRDGSPIKCLWFEDVTSFKSLIGSDVVYTADVVLVTWRTHFPRRPAPSELIFSPKNICYQIVEVEEHHEIYHLALVRLAAQAGRPITTGGIVTPVQ
jgi:hypothetical protein